MGKPILPTRIAAMCLAFARFHKNAHICFIHSLRRNINPTNHPDGHEHLLRLLTETEEVNQSLQQLKETLEELSNEDLSNATRNDNEGSTGKID